MPSSAASPGLAKKSPVLRPAGSVLPVGDVAARWYEIARENGKDAVRCDVPWGRPVRAETVETAHDREACECRRSRAQRDKHGRAEPLAEVAASHRGRPEVLLLVVHPQTLS